MAVVRAVLVLLLLQVGCDKLFDLEHLEPVPFDGASRDDAPIDNTLIAWYPMDELLDEGLPDASGHGHTARCAGQQCPASTDGALSGALRFDGIDDILVVDASPELITPDEYTVAFWMQLDSLPISGVECPMNKGLGGGAQNSWQLCVGTGGTLIYGTQGSNVTGASAVGATEWLHVALRWDGTTKRLFVNGVATGNADQPPAMFDNDTIRFGADLDSGGLVAPFRGALDEIRLYSRALSEAEIAELAQ